MTTFHRSLTVSISVVLSAFAVVSTLTACGQKSNMMIRTGGGTPGDDTSPAAKTTPLPALQPQAQTLVVAESLMKIERSFSFLARRPSISFSLHCGSYQVRPTAPFMTADFKCAQQNVAADTGEKITVTIAGQELYYANPKEFHADAQLKIVTYRQATPPILAAEVREIRRVAFPIINNGIGTLTASITQDDSNLNRRAQSEMWNATTTSTWALNNDGTGMLKAGAVVALDYRPVHSGTPTADVNNRLVLTATEDITFSGTNCVRPVGSFNWQLTRGVKTSVGQVKFAASGITGAPGATSTTPIAWPTNCIEDGSN